MGNWVPESQQILISCVVMLVGIGAALAVFQTVAYIWRKLVKDDEEDGEDE